MPVGQTGLTLWDMKQQDFNFPAPLDMTNISINYKTDWLVPRFDPESGLWRDFGDWEDPIFIKNTEPGASHW